MRMTKKIAAVTLAMFAAGASRARRRGNSRPLWQFESCRYSIILVVYRASATLILYKFLRVVQSSENDIILFKLY